ATVPTQGNNCSLWSVATPTTGDVAPTGGRDDRGRQPLAGWPQPVVPTGGRPLQVVRPWPPLQGPGCGQPPLHAESMHVAAPPPQAMPTFAANRYNKHVEQFYVIQSHHT
ncbi:hypothetical protein BHE74_00041955, partial [Ensete ventricosum]